MKIVRVSLVVASLICLVGCGGDDGGDDTGAGGNDAAVTGDGAGGDDTAGGGDTGGGGGGTTCTLTVAGYVAMTKFIELKNDDASCVVSFKVAPDKDGAPDWDNMVKTGSVIPVVEGWDPPKANVTYPCEDPLGVGRCGAQTGTVTLGTFEPVAADCQEGGSVTGKKIAGSVDVSGDRPGNTGAAKFDFDLTFN